MHETGLAMIITRFRRFSWNFMMKYNDIDLTLVVPVPGLDLIILNSLKLSDALPNYILS